MYWLWLLLAIAVDTATPFVVAPDMMHTKVKQLVEPGMVPSALRSSLKNTNPTENKNFLANTADKITSILPFGRGKKEQDDDKELFVPRSERSVLTKKEINNAVAPFPWPVRAVARSIAQTVNRELAKEERKVKPLLKQAVILMYTDTDLMNVLGTPVKVGRMMSQRSEETRVNRKTTFRIIDTFEVIGTKGSGVATMHADNYAIGHIQALRVDVGGIHYDINV